jgi:hypothetical protein
MKLSRILLLIAALLATSSALPADDTKEFLDPANWHGRSDIWSITGDSIVGETKEDPKYNTFFVSKKTYSDFEISFKVQLKGGVGNSGLQIRSTLMDEAKFTVKGPQVDVGKGYWGSLYGEGVGGMMKASNKADIEKAVKETEFNDYKIVAKGTKITIIINGTCPAKRRSPPRPMASLPSRPTAATSRCASSSRTSSSRI